MRRPSTPIVLLSTLGTLVAYAGAAWWLVSRHPLPPLDGRAVTLLSLAVLCEGVAKWEAGRLFRRGAARMGESVTRRAAFRGALAGASVARLVPMGGALTPHAMAWTSGARSEAGVQAGVHTATLNYSWLLVVAGAGAGWAGAAESGGWALVGVGVIAVLAGVSMLVAAHRLRRLSRFLPGRLGAAADRFLPDLPPDARSLALAATRIVWEVTALGLVLAALRLGADPGETVIAFGVSQVASGVPGVPGGVGVAEAGLVGALSLLGFPAATTIGPALVFRVVSSWIPALAGLMAGAASFLATPTPDDLPLLTLSAPDGVTVEV